MTYRAKYFSQQGITLLLAILILSAVLAIAFSMATIIFVEIRVSGDAVKTESAISAADAITEEAMFNIKRKVDRIIPGGNFPYTTSLGGVDLAHPTPAARQDTVHYFQTKVLPASNSLLNSENRYPLFNIVCPSPIVDPADPVYISDPVCPTGGSGYGKLTITNLDVGNGDAMTVYVCEYDPRESYLSPACSDTDSDEYWSPNGNTDSGKGVVLASGGVINFLVDPYKQQEVILVNVSGSNSIWGQIQAFGKENPVGSGIYPAKGLPLVGSTAVDVTAHLSGVTRKLRITVPQEGSTVAKQNYALASNGATVTSPSSTLWLNSGLNTEFVNDGNRKGTDFFAFREGWMSGPILPTSPSTDGAVLEIDFGAPKTITEVDLFSVQDSYWSPQEPTPTMTCSSYCVDSFYVQYWTGSVWQDIPGASVASTNLVWNSLTFGAVNTSKIRIVVTNLSGAHRSARLIEVEVY